VYNLTSQQVLQRSPAVPGIGSKIMTTYTYQAATFNGVKGFFAERRINGVYAGKQFGKTQKASREAFEA